SFRHPPPIQRRRYVEVLKLTKARTSDDSDQERSRKALTPAEADNMLRAWTDSSTIDRRDRALVARGDEAHSGGQAALSVLRPTPYRLSVRALPINNRREAMT